MYFRVRYMRMGAHVFCRVFASEEMGGTFTLLGSLMCNEKEFAGLQQELRNAPFEDMELLVRDCIPKV